MHLVRPRQGKNFLNRQKPLAEPEPFHFGGKGEFSLFAYTEYDSLNLVLHGVQPFNGTLTLRRSYRTAP